MSACVCGKAAVSIGGGQSACQCQVYGEAVPFTPSVWTEEDEAEREVEQARMNRAGIGDEP